MVRLGSKASGLKDFNFIIMRFRLAILLIGSGLSLLAGCPSPSTPIAFTGATPTPTASPAAVEVTKDEYAVYAAILQHDSQPSNTSKKLFVIEEDTLTEAEKFCSLQQIFGKKAAEMQPLITSFRRQNQESAKLARQFNALEEYVLVKRKEVLPLFNFGKPGKPEFVNQYAGASRLVSFSRVGFNPDQTMALVYQESFCGALCGAGQFRLLRIKGAGWVVAKDLLCWVS